MKASYSKEYLYVRGAKSYRALSILFKKTSSSYNEFGEFVVVEPIWDDENEVRVNSENGVNTYGQIKAKIIVEDQFSNEQLERMMEVGFDTDDICVADHV